MNLLQQHPELADVDVRKAMVLLPEDVAVRRAVADMNCRHGQVDEAIKELRPLVRSDRVDITLRLAEALRTRGAPSNLNESTALLQGLVETENRVARGGREYVASVVIELLVKAQRWADAERVCEMLASRGVSSALAMGHSPTLLAQLSSVESEISRLDSRLNATNKPLEFAANIKEMREFVTQKALDLTAVLRSDVATARRVLANHVQKLALTPKETPDGGVLEVSGDVDLFGGDDRVMHVVAKDGFGLNYTQGFPLATMLMPHPEAEVSPL